MLEGVMLLWFIQVAIATAFVAVDIRTTPEATIMKWGFVIITLFSGLLGALLYVLSFREPLPGTHELYVAAKWRQVVGSTMHCVAGDGIGILVAAVITSRPGLSMRADVLCEYALGFLFGWSVFQALFMKGMFGSYLGSLTDVGIFYHSEFARPADRNNRHRCNPGIDRRPFTFSFIRKLYRWQSSRGLQQLVVQIPLLLFQLRVLFLL